MSCCGSFGKYCLVAAGELGMGLPVPVPSPEKYRVESESQKTAKLNVRISESCFAVTPKGMPKS